MRQRAKKIDIYIYILPLPCPLHPIREKKKKNLPAPSKQTPLHEGAGRSPETGSNCEAARRRLAGTTEPAPLPAGAGVELVLGLDAVESARGARPAGAASGELSETRLYTQMKSISNKGDAPRGKRGVLVRLRGAAARRSRSASIDVHTCGRVSNKAHNSVTDAGLTCEDS
jgi:hypothetical protein